MDFFNVWRIIMLGLVLGSLVALCIILVIVIVLAINYRRVVPTNMVHIVQSKHATTSYGRGKVDGNIYYAWPSWVPKIGISVTEFPESIFKVSLENYHAYDQARLPFQVDVYAFFRVSDSGTAAQRVASFDELASQLHAVLQGCVRRILSTNALEHIMEARASLSLQFTQEVQAQICEWGVVPAKSIEFMDIRDVPTSPVIHNIMQKEQSRIERESRVAVAENHKEAEMAEIDAKRTVDVQRQDALQQVGIRTAEKNKIIGMAEEVATQNIKSEAKITAEREMDLLQVQNVREAEIAAQVMIVAANQARETTIIASEGQKQQAIIVAEGQLQEQLKASEAVRAMGLAKAEAETAMLMAPVTTQTTLAKEIGANLPYQQYLINIEQVAANKEIGIKMAEAIAQADIKIIGTGGNIQNDMKKVTDMFTPAGGTSIAGMLTGLAQTDEGKALVDKITK